MSVQLYLLTVKVLHITENKVNHFLAELNFLRL